MEVDKRSLMDTLATQRHALKLLYDKRAQLRDQVSAMDMQITGAEATLEELVDLTNGLMASYDAICGARKKWQQMVGDGSHNTENGSSE